MIRFVGDVDYDQVKLPMISITRLGYSILENYNGPKQRVGLPALVRNNVGNKAKGSVQAIMIRIDYQIDIWTKDRLTNDNITRELIFYLINHPTFEINIPYGVEINHKFNIFLDTEVEDNSDISAHDETGQLFRTTLSAYTDDAHLFNAETTNEYKVKIIVEGVDLNGEVYDL